jgi:hypothetical protein
MILLKVLKATPTRSSDKNRMKMGMIGCSEMLDRDRGRRIVVF